MNGKAHPRPEAAVVVPLDRRATDPERSIPKADPTASDADQTAADADQTAADADQTASERDEADAASDQRAAEQDQASADQQRAGDPGVPAEEVYEASRVAREASTVSRLFTRISRTTTSRMRGRTAAARDTTAARRDATARRRDVRASAMDLRIASSDEPATRKLAQLRARSAAARGRAATDRDRAAQDRSEASSERDRLQAELEDAHLDDLTGAFRREMGHLALTHEIDRARRGDGRYVIAFVDVDGMKTVNDQAGHAAGDQVLRSVASTIRANLRSFDPVVRYGGDEFVCGLGGVDLDNVERRFDSIDRSVRGAVGVGISVGLAALGKGETLDDVTARADARLGEAKRKSGTQRTQGSAARHN